MSNLSLASVVSLVLLLLFCCSNVNIGGLRSMFVFSSPQCLFVYAVSLRCRWWNSILCRECVWFHTPMLLPLLTNTALWRFFFFLLLFFSSFGSFCVMFSVLVVFHLHTQTHIHMYISKFFLGASLLLCSMHSLSFAWLADIGFFTTSPRLPPTISALPLTIH